MKAYISSLFAALSAAISPTYAPAPGNTEITSNQPQHFVPSGARIIDTIKNDAPDRSRLDTILVIETPSPANEMPEGNAQREVIVLARGDHGEMREVARSSKVVPCSKCGGSLGDPYAFIRIDKDLFSVHTSGGMGIRWKNRYFFRFSPSDKTWVLDSAIRGIYDLNQENYRETRLGSNDFGKITFSDFDEERLEKPELPR